MADTELERAVGRIEGRLEEIDRRLGRLEAMGDLLLQEIRRLELNQERLKRRNGRALVALMLAILALWEGLKKLIFG